MFGGFVYTPAANYFGLDAFTYQYSNADGTELSNTVTDGDLVSNTATVRITVTAVNDAPTLDGHTLTATEGMPLVVNLLAGI